MIGETTFVIISLIIITIISFIVFIVMKIIHGNSNQPSGQPSGQPSYYNYNYKQRFHHEIEPANSLSPVSPVAPPSPSGQTQIIRVNIPIGGVGDGLSHIFTFIVGKTPSGFLVEIPPASPVPLGMIVVNYTGNIIGYIVPVNYQSQTQMPTPVLVLDPTTIGPNNFVCNQPYACGAVNLTTVLTPTQAAMIGSYTGTLPTYSNGTPLSNSPTMNSFGSTATTLSF